MTACDTRGRARLRAWAPFVLHTCRLQLYTRVVSVAAVILKIILTMLVTVEEDAPLR